MTKRIIYVEQIDEIRVNGFNTMECAVDLKNFIAGDLDINVYINTNQIIKILQSDKSISLIFKNIKVKDTFLTILGQGYIPYFRILENSKRITVEQ
ncbi:MAG: hypothetical protein ACP5N1_06570 [Candidatus Woesearchaeota archaeon]